MQYLAPGDTERAEATAAGGMGDAGADERPAVKVLLLCWVGMMMGPGRGTRQWMMMRQSDLRNIRWCERSGRSMISFFFCGRPVAAFPKAMG